jgi:hypothetical protein
MRSRTKTSECYEQAVLEFIEQNTECDIYQIINATGINYFNVRRIIHGRKDSTFESGLVFDNKIIAKPGTNNGKLSWIYSIKTY